MWEFDEELIHSYELALQFEFDRSEAIASKRGNEPAALYLAHLNEALALFLTENQQRYEPFKLSTDERLGQLDAFEESPYKGYYIAQIKLHLSFLQIKFGEELSATWSFRQSYRTIQRNTERYPEFALNNKILGIQEVLIGSAPDRHQWLLRVLGFYGDIDEGLHKLTEFSKEAGFRKMENDLVLAFIYSHLLQDKEMSLSILKTYQRKARTNPLVNFAWVSILSKFSEGEKAYQVLTSFRSSPTAFPFPFTHYLAANLELQRGDYSASATDFRKFLRSYHGANYVKDASYKTGISYYLQNQPEEAESWFEKAREATTAVTEADKYASHALNASLPDPRLLQARYYTDGGYYRKAATILESLSDSVWSRPRDQIEYPYRYARLYHLTDRPELAIPYYKRTIELTLADRWYFAPNAALQLGYIYLKKDDLDAAELFFKLCLDYNNHPYQNSIDNKAKAGLATIKRLRRGD